MQHPIVSISTHQPSVAQSRGNVRRRYKSGLRPDTPRLRRAPRLRQATLFFHPKIIYFSSFRTLARARKATTWLGDASHACAWQLDTRARARSGPTRYAHAPMRACARAATQCRYSRARACAQRGRDSGMRSPPRATRGGWTPHRRVGCRLRRALSDTVGKVDALDAVDAVDAVGTVDTVDTIDMVDTVSARHGRHVSTRVDTCRP